MTTRKQKLLDYARNLDNPMPSRTVDASLYDAFRDLCIPGRKIFDPAIRAEVENLHPDWFWTHTLRNDNALVVLAQSGAEKPHHTSTMGQLLSRRYHTADPAHDPDLINKLYAIRPDWWPEGLYPEDKRIRLLEMAKSGHPRPKNMDPMYHVLHRLYKQQDPDYQTIIKLRPDWMPASQRLLDLAHGGAERPHSGDPLYKYCQKQFERRTGLYDKIIEIRPDWLIPTLSSEQQRLLDHAEGGGRPPKREEEGLFRSWKNARAKKTKLYDKIIEIRPDWITKPKTHKEEILDRARSGAARPRNTDACYGRWCKMVSKNEQTYRDIIALRPDWASHRARKRAERNQNPTITPSQQLVVDRAMSGQPAPQNSDGRIYATWRSIARSKNLAYEMIATVAPDWVSTEYRPSPSEQALIEHVRNGGEMPSKYCATHLRYAWEKVRAKRNEAYQIIIGLNPSWTVRYDRNQHCYTDAQQELLYRATAGLPPPSIKKKDESTLHRAWRRLRERQSALYRTIAEMRPDWLDGLAIGVDNIRIARTVAQQTLLAAAQRGDPRPTQRIDQCLYKCWLSQRRKDSALYRHIVELRPDWIETRAIKEPKVKVIKEARLAKIKVPPKPKVVKEPKPKVVKEPKPKPEKPISVPTVSDPSDRNLDRDTSRTVWSPSSTVRNPFRGVRGLGLLVDMWRENKKIPDGPLLDCLRDAVRADSEGFNADFVALVREEASYLLNDLT